VLDAHATCSTPTVPRWPRWRDRQTAIVEPVTARLAAAGRRSNSSRADRSVPAAHGSVGGTPCERATSAGVWCCGCAQESTDKGHHRRDLFVAELLVKTAAMPYGRGLPSVLGRKTPLRTMRIGFTGLRIVIAGLLASGG